MYIRRRSLSLKCGTCCSVLLCWFLASGAPAAEPQAGAQLSLEEAAALATRFYDEGRLRDASVIVRALRPLPGVPAQIVFLSAKLYEADGDWTRAIDEYRVLLVDRPDLTRVRLDLARALYMAGEYDQARYHFERVQSADVPGTVHDNVARYLDLIRERDYAVQLNLDVVADSNINQGPAGSSIYLLGANYILSDQAQQQSGVGLWLGLSGQVALRWLSRGAFARGSLDYQSYPGGAFDFLIGQATAGQQWRIGRGWFAVEGGYLESRFGGNDLYQGPLVQLSAGSPLGRRVSAGCTLVLRDLNYPDYAYLSGPNVWLLPTLTYYPDGVTIAQVTAGAGLTRAAESAYSNTSVLLSPILSRDFAGGWSGYVTLLAQYTGFDQPDPLFAITRRDTLLQAEVGGNRRDWSWRGFSPRLAVRATWSTSTIALYEFQRVQLLLGVTRQF